MILDASYLLRSEESSMLCTVLQTLGKNLIVPQFIRCESCITQPTQIWFFAKTRQLPTVKKKMTMPRPELNAARIAVRLATSVKEALSSYVKEECHMWNDSNIVLHWLEGKGTYKQFVEHRVREICSLMPDVSWKYCPTDENPADFGTRRNTPRQLQESKLWWNGLSYLCTDRWPHQQHIDQMHYEGQEEEIQPVLQVQTRLRTVRACQPSSSWKNLVPGTDC